MGTMCMTHYTTLFPKSESSEPTKNRAITDGHSFIYLFIYLVYVISSIFVLVFGNDHDIKNIVKFRATIC